MDIHDQQTAAWRRWKAGERGAAGRQFFAWYAPLVRAWARRLATISQNMGFDDFVQLGNIGIMKALDSFERSNGGKLPHWIKLWVQAECMAAIQSQNGAFSIPKSRREIKIQRHFGRDSAKMLEAGFSWNDIRETLAVKYRVHPLDIDALHMMRNGRQSIREENTDDVNLAGTVQLVSDDLPAEDLTTHSEASKTIQRLFSEAGLTERERVCVLARFTDGEEVPFEVLGAKFGVSRERARQYVQKGLEKMRRLAAKQGLVFEDLW